MSFNQKLEKIYEKKKITKNYFCSINLFYIINSQL